MFPSRSYNRFAGNPPAGLTPQQAYVAENGDLPLDIPTPQEVVDEITNLTTRVTALETKTASLP